MLDYEYLKTLNMADEILVNDNNTSVNFEFEGSFYVLDSEQFFKLFNAQYEEKLRNELKMPLLEVMDKNYTDIYAVTDMYVDADIDGSIKMTVILSIEDDKFNAEATLDRTALMILKDKCISELENMSTKGLSEENAKAFNDFLSGFKANVQQFIDNSDHEEPQMEIDR